MADLHNVCVIFLNQMRTKLGVMFGDPRKTAGGSAPEFCFSQRLWLSAKQIKKTPSSEPEGMEVTGKFMKNKISAPFREATWRFMFQEDGSGKFDFERSLIDFMDDKGFLEHSGAPGAVKFEGKSINKEKLARQIEAEGATGFVKLKALLPPKYEVPVVATVNIASDEEEA